MKTIRLAYANMWGDAAAFDAAYLLKCFPYLAPHYTFVLDRRDPQLVFHSVYGYVAQPYPYPNAIRLVYAGEAGDHFSQGGKMAPGHNEPGFYHYGLTCAVENTHPNHCYYPQPALMLALHNGVGLSALVRPPEYVPPRKEHFCDFIYSNGNSRRRVEFFHALSQYRRVESCGAVERNNNALVGTGYDTAGYRAKQSFEARCKFSVAFENTYWPGYTSEKLTDAFVAGSVPIYSGNPRVADFFNQDAMINVDAFASDDAAIAHIAAVDHDDALYHAYATAPPFRGNVVPESIGDATYLAFWQRILEAV